MTKKRRKKTIKQLAQAILRELHEIDQKVEHIIQRLPKNGHLLHDPQWNRFFD
jgi:ABC-type Zn uptake system ZnuABC Zn-binding protein ZnuA